MVRDHNNHATTISGLQASLLALQGQFDSMQDSHQTLVAASKGCCYNETAALALIRANVNDIIKEVDISGSSVVMVCILLTFVGIFGSVENFSIENVSMGPSECMLLQRNIAKTCVENTYTLTCIDYLKGSASIKGKQKLNGNFPLSRPMPDALIMEQ